MSDYIITVNSTVDTTREWLAERGVPYIPLKYTIDGQTYSDMEGLSSKEFFDKLREGKMSTTSQINPDEAREALEPSERRKGYFASFIFIWIKWNMQQYENCGRGTSRGVSRT